MNNQDLKKLQEIQEYPSISIFLNTSKHMPERLQDPITLKDLISQATEKLLTEFDKTSVSNIIKSLDEVASKIDFTTVLDSIVIFINKNISVIYKLPFKIEQKVVIDKKFVIKDLLYALNRHPSYWILALSESPTRLFKVYGNNLKEVQDAPELQEKQEGFPFKLNYEVTSDRKWQAVSEGDKDSTYFTALENHFYTQVDHLLKKYLNHEELPVIVLATPKHKGTFEKITKNGYAIIGYGHGDFSKAKLEEIEKVAWPILQEYLDKEALDTIKLFQESIGNKHSAFGIKEVWAATQEGRTRILLIENDYVANGILNPENPDNIMLEEDMNLPLKNNLVDYLIDLALSKRTKVVFVKPGSLKEHGHVAAILRY